MLIDWYRDGALLTEKAFTPNAGVYFCRTTVERFDKIEITLNKTALPKRYAKLSQVVIGVNRVFDMPSQIRSAKIIAQTDLLAAGLPVGTLEFVLDSAEDIEYIFQERQPFEVRCSGFGQQEESETTVGGYYLSSVKRISKHTYSISAEDAVGVLDADADYPGGTGTRVTLRAI